MASKNNSHSMEIQEGEIGHDNYQTVMNGKQWSESTEQSQNDDRAEAVLTHRIENISTLTKTELSSPFYIRNLPWKLMLIPSTDSLPQRHFGFFLQCNAESDSSTWSCYAFAELRIKPFTPYQEPYQKKIKHLFNSKENDWGYARFITWQQLMDSEVRLLEKDSITLEAYVVAEAPHGVLWDSKKYTGFVGLKNQGATCYMNSLLQTLYFTNFFRKAVYKMPTECDENNKSVALALQRVFYDLQFSDKPVGTKKLTKSFGWDTLDSFMQHDVQEFLRVLLDKLEDKMKGTSLEGIIPKLFEGKMISYIKCKNVDITSKRVESYYDIQLNIKGNNNIYESFKDYVATEILEGDNKYDAGEHGLQDAEKGVLFISFPPVLHLHLMRFQYDPITDNSVKFNDRFEFYEEIELEPYLAEQDLSNATYKLHAVLVHSGDNHGGHYVVYINPLADGKWCKFDDDVVCSCTKLDAIERNYGGTDEDISLNDKQNSNAYMLVYIKVPEISRILQVVKKSDIPFELYQKLEEEKRIDAIRRIERSEAHAYITIQVLLEEYIEENQGMGLFDAEKVQLRVLKFKKTQTMVNVLEVIAEAFKVKLSRMRVWTLVPPLQILHPIYFEYNEEKNIPLSNLADSQYCLAIFLEMADVGTFSHLQSFDKKSEVILFFKLFDHKMKTINYLFHGQYSIHTKLSDLVPILNEHLGLQSNPDYILYEERNSNYLRKLSNFDESLDKALQIMSTKRCGYILVFEEKFSNNEKVFSCEDYVRELIYKVDVTFVDMEYPNDSGFILELSQQYNYEKMALAVAKRINADPNKIQFYKCQSCKDLPGSILKYNSENNLKEILSQNRSQKTKKLFYEKITINIKELENKIQFKCLLVSSNMKEQEDIVVYVNKTGTIQDLLNEAKNIYKFSENSTRQLRLLEVINYKICPPRSLDTKLEVLQNSCNENLPSNDKTRAFRIEEIPPEEIHLDEDELLVPVSHFNKEVCNSFGVPFLIKAKQSESYGDLKFRMQKKLSIPPKDFKEYKVVFVAQSRTVYVADENTVNLPDFKPSDSSAPYLALEHADKSQKRIRHPSSEKAIKIYN